VSNSVYASLSRGIQICSAFDLRMKSTVMRKNNSGMLGISSIDTHYARSASSAVAMLFQGKWRVEILCAMRSGLVRVGQLPRLIPGASKKMLAHNLRRLEVDGFPFAKAEGPTERRRRSVFINGPASLIPLPIRSGDPVHGPTSRYESGLDERTGDLH
jgi:DNA-binding HxlR family transcriptional regulator